MAYNQEVVSSKLGTIYKMIVSDASYYIQTMKTKTAKWGKPEKIVIIKHLFLFG